MRSAWWLTIALVGPLMAGCIGADDEPVAPTGILGVLTDGPLKPVADPFYDAPGVPNTHYHANPTGEDAPFHTLEEIEAKVMGWAETYPGLVRVDVIGHSIQGRPIWDVVLTNRAVPGPKPTPLLDGGHHANELGGIEYTLFTVDFLLQNYPTNATIRAIVDDLEIHVVPLVNPDGYIVQTRGNALGVNLNRNYDIDWGNPAGASNLLMGTLAHATGETMPSVPVAAENSGPYPASEPETQAMVALMHRLAPTAAFYLTGHTPTHAVISPWAAYEHPFEIPPEQAAVMEAELQWIRDHTEYEAGKAEWGNFSAGLPYSASGSSMDYFYMVTGKAAFTVEVEFWYTAATSENWPDRALGFYEGLRYWMDATLPIPMHLLANAHRLQAWELPDQPPPIPAGSVPTPPDRSAFMAPPPVLH